MTTYTAKRYRIAVNADTGYQYGAPGAGGDIRSGYGRSFWVCDAEADLPTTGDGAKNGDFAVAIAEQTMWTRAGGAWSQVAAGGAGAPTGADYLVGTAQGGLSAEIVVGTTPGGELGGTWASPTVDATHSGSSHAGVVATHEAAGDPHTGYRLESADHTHASSGIQGGTVAHSALTGLTAGDDHTQYRLESADHTHASSGLQGGTLDHGTALTGLSDDDHPQYLKESDVDAVTFTIGAFFETTGTLTTGTRPIWRAPFACTVTAVRGYVDTGNTTVINAGKGAASSSDFCSSNITIDPSDAWENGTVDQNTSISSGDTISVEIVTAGTATQLTIQVELTRDLSP